MTIGQPVVLVMQGFLVVYINNSLHLARKYARIFFHGHYLFRVANKTVSYKEQIMSKDKYTSKFSSQMEAIVFVILQIFYATRAVLKLGEYPRIFLSFSWGIFTHVTRLDQWCASENIWWIIMGNITQDTSVFLVYSWASIWLVETSHEHLADINASPIVIYQYQKHMNYVLLV